MNHTPQQVTLEGMTPCALVLLLELYYLVGVNVETPARIQALDDFNRLGLTDGAKRRLGGSVEGKLTDRGLAHVKALTQLPLPVAHTVWKTPTKENTE